MIFIANIIADKMNGFSAALVVKVANDAAKTAILENKNIIEQAHLLSAFEENFNYNK